LFLKGIFIFKQYITFKCFRSESNRYFYIFKTKQILIVAVHSRFRSALLPFPSSSARHSPKLLVSKVTNKSCLKLLFKNHAEKKCLASVGGRKQKPKKKKNWYAQV